MKATNTLVYTMLVLSGVLVFLISSTTSIQAHGRDTHLIKENLIGPYKLQVTISPGTPVIGTLHIGLLIRDNSSDSMVTDAIVSVIAKDPQHNIKFESPTGHMPIADEGQYEVDIPVDVTGNWIIEFGIQSHIGNETFALPIQVDSRPGISLAIVATSAITLLVISMWLYKIVTNIVKPRT